MVIACCNHDMKGIADIRRDNLRALVDEHGLAQVAKRVKRSATQLSDTLAGRKSFGEKVARAIEREWDPSLSSGWLDISGQEIDANVEPGPEMRGLVPIISWVQAGQWCDSVDLFQPGDSDEWLACPAKHGPHTFALRVRGVSMEPKYFDGAIIFVDPDRTADHLSNVVVRLDHDNEVTFKQLVIEDGVRFLRPLNPDWPGPKLIKVESDSVICGVVIGQFIED